MKANSHQIRRNYNCPHTWDGCEDQTLRKSDINRIQLEESQFIRRVKGCKQLDRYNDEVIRKDLNVHPITYTEKNIQNCWDTPYEQNDFQLKACS